MQTDKKNIIIAKKIVRSFKDGNNITTVLEGSSRNKRRRKFIAMMGRSGAGKSTTLYQTG